MAFQAVQHMNKDHSDSVEDYVHHYAKKPNATKCVMADMDELGVLISYEEDGQENSVRIPFEPPLGSLKEARVRLIEMDGIARKALGRKPREQKSHSHGDATGKVEPPRVIVDQFVLPAPANLVLYGLLTFGLLYIKDYQPQILSDYSYWFAGVLFFIVAAHLVEIVFVMQPLLRKYGVTDTNRKLWLLSTMFEGAFALKRFRRMVAAARPKSE
ncbi:hypothetical protein PROFUN_04064 [Planoprotostelium fungivorum]|uniref:DUF2470 domain-containing protein n=1 Tax=Planoprotostelium fungivorum TaxID=1890364 RepID=A0A2P6NJD1_9EUKA|nr:hypothetical protein PROFUN_04064 [Planoprotostelium fungivorum]